MPVIGRTGVAAWALAQVVGVHLLHLGAPSGGEQTTGLFALATELLVRRGKRGKGGPS